MRKKILLAIFVAAVLSGGAVVLLRRQQPQTSQPPQIDGPAVGVHTTPTSQPVVEPTPPVETGSSLVRLSDEAAKARFLAANGLGTSDLQVAPGLINTYVVNRPTDSLDTTGALVSEQLIYNALLSPNDPIYPQWYTDKISAPSAWDRTTGSAGITVAVIDTGFGLNHEDMASRWATNTGEVGGGKETNGADDDSNGFVDDWRGWDFNSNDNNPVTGQTNPNGNAVDHGTITAGLVGATGNNSLGVASVNWAAKILPLQALSDNGSGITSTVAAAVRYATDRGAKVINLSLGSTISDPILQAEINYAISHDVVVVAAAGNCGDPSSYFLNGCSSVGQMVYPANYPAVVAVGATDSNDVRASFSSYGANLDLVAPGAGSIQAPDWSNTNQTNLYTSGANGTSFAAPIVSGSVALLLSIAPDLSPAEAETSLRQSADKPAAMGDATRTDSYGYGRLNSNNLVNLRSGSTAFCDTSRVRATTLGTYNPNTATFYERNCHSPGPASLAIQYGNANWVPLSGDWNRDGVFTPGAYDPANGRFYLRNTNDGGPADIAFQYGNLGWTPLAGDWNNNGYWSVGLYDPASSKFYLKDFNGGGAADYVALFGNSGWKPLVGDWDNNGSTTIGVNNPANAMYYLNDQHDGSPAERSLQYGNAGWTPLGGDWDGNGWWSIGAYDPNTALYYLRNLNSSGSANITVQYGNAGWLPVMGDWDGR